MRRDEKRLLARIGAKEMDRENEMKKGTQNQKYYN